jgi:acetolactate synthase-1/2/3 large subunit
MGVPGTRVEDVDGLRRALEHPGTGPRLIDARIDPSAYRHVITTIRG